MTSFEYDLVVIGSGPAGEKGAAQAAYYGKKVALIERQQSLGGAGINTGTLPSKTLRETALYFSGLRQRGLYGIDYSLKEGLTIADFMYRKQVVVENEWEIIRHNLERHHIELIWGEASLKDDHTVQIHCRDGRSQDLTTEVVLIATGSSPWKPPDIPFDNVNIFDSDTILNMDHIPQSMAVVGGGVIGTEYASIFTALGVQVTLIDGRDRLLPFADAEIVARMQTNLESLGLRFIFNAKVDSVSLHGDHVHLTLSAHEQIIADTVLFAAGRISNVEGLGLEALGIELGKRGLIIVNEKYQTTVPNIYAAGDVIGFPALASTSMEQARVAMVHAFGLQYKERVSPTLPFAVYSIPEIASVGLSETQCQEQAIPALAGRAQYRENPRGLIVGDLTGMLKLVFSPEDKRLLGAHIIGEMASELIHVGAHVLHNGGTIDTFIEAVYNYPTLHDLYKYAAYDGLGALDRWKKQRSL